MQLKHVIPLSLFCIVMLFTTSNANAEQKMQLGGWDVHYIVFGTSFLTPEVASQYGIVRSKFNALVNISVLDTTSQEAQTVALSGKATNLLGTSRELKFKKVVDGKAIYYLAIVPFRDQETFRFSIDVMKGGETQTLKFQQKMYVD